MTFQDFQKTRQFLIDSDDNSDRGFIYLKQYSPYLYDGNLSIAMNEDGSFCLTICNESWVEFNLPVLERKLYKFIDDEGYFDNEDFNN